MKHIEIEWTYDDYDCEACGGSYASGANVKIDGVTFGNFEAVAHCYGGSSHSQEDVLRAIIKELGGELEEH